MTSTRRIERDLVGLLQHTRIDKDCWRWTGATVAGYGYVHDEQRHKIRTHRLIYTLVYGPIPENFQIDHVWLRGCRFTDCLRPDHLEAVPLIENVERQWQAEALQGMCRKGLHAMSIDNVYVTPAGAHRCRTCVRDRERRTHIRKGNPR